VLDFYLNLTLAENATRFPSKVKLNLRVPYFSELGNYYNVEVINSQYTAPSSVSETGLVFQVIISLYSYIIYILQM